MLRSFIYFLIRQSFRLLKRLFKTCCQIFLLGCACILLLWAAITLVNLKQKRQEGKIEAGTILVLDLAEPLTESHTGLRSFHPQATTLWSALQALKHAADDARIAGLLIRGDSTLPSTQGEVLKHELFQAISRFKEKKPVIAYLRNSSRQDYTLASSAHKVYMHPLGLLGLLGVGYEGIYFGEAFQKYGLKAHVFKCGRYKSATEPFTSTGMSPESKEQLSAFIETLWQQSLDKITQNRLLSTAHLNTLSQTEGLFSPARALELHLIDGILYEDEACSQFEKAVFQEKKQDYQKVFLRHYAESLEKPKANTPTIAILYAEGILSKNTKDWETLPTAAFIKELRKLRSKDTIQGILIRMNSPGGEASLAEDLRREITLTAAQKPVVVSMGSYAASGAYWASLGASTVFANPSTLTGSIGVFGMLIDWAQLGQKHGIHSDRVATSPLSSLYSTSQAKSEAELKVLQDMADYTYELFLHHVASARGLTLEVVRSAAEGRIFSGVKALELGLVDAVGTLEDALEFMTQGLEDFQVKEYPKTKSYVEVLEDFWEGHNALLSQLVSFLPTSFHQLLFPVYASSYPSVLTLLDPTLLSPL